MPWLNSPEYGWLLLPLFIFLARIVDVTLGTLRIVYLARGKRSIAPIFGFFEVLIWIMIIGQIVQNLSNPVSYLAYAAGFAAGNYIGLLIEEKLALGMLSLRVILVKDAGLLVQRLHEEGFGATRLCGEGSIEHVEVVYIIIDRKNLKKVAHIVKEVNPRAFYLVEEVRSVYAGIFPPVRRTAAFHPASRARK
jgi:uncharacterized protein YebE (UPF0316 family)